MVVVVVVILAVAIAIATFTTTTPALVAGEEAEEDWLLAGGFPGPVLLLIVIFGHQSAARDPHYEAYHEVEAGVGEEAAGRES